VNDSITFPAEEVNFGMTFGIFNCKDTTVTVMGKCKSILLEGCKKVTLIVDKVVSQVEVLNCGVVKIKALN